VSRSVLVAVGGLIGSVARYWLAGAVQRFSNSAFLVGTFTVNLVCSFLVGLVMALSIERGLLNANLRLFLPILIEIVDSEEKVRAALPYLDTMLDTAGGGGLVTLESAEIIKYTQGQRS